VFIVVFISLSNESGNFWINPRARALICIDKTLYSVYFSISPLTVKPLERRVMPEEKDDQPNDNPKAKRTSWVWNESV